MPPDRIVCSTRGPSAGASAHSGDDAGRPARKPDATAVQRFEPNTLYVERTRKGRGGKTVTLVQNFQGDHAARSGLLKALKTACGAGGTIKDGVLEIQGDQRDRVLGQLQQLGYRVKARGG